jgi:hypothetical protein
MWSLASVSFLINLFLHFYSRPVVNEEATEAPRPARVTRTKQKAVPELAPAKPAAGNSSGTASDSQASFLASEYSILTYRKLSNEKIFVFKALGHIFKCASLLFCIKIPVVRSVLDLLGSGFFVLGVSVRARIFLKNNTHFSRSNYAIWGAEGFCWSLQANYTILLILSL